MKKDEDVANVANAGRAIAAVKPDFSLIDESLLKSRIHTIRGVKVMLDADLAEIYGYSTSRFNEQVKYNIGRFDEDFRFQLKKEELSDLISEIPISKRGGTRKMPYAFTEQGIYMLMTVLRGERAIAQSKALIRLFKQMKDYIVSENLQLLSPESPQIASYTIQNIKDIADIRGELAETRADVSEMKSDLQKVMENFIDPSSFKHYLILNGKKLEADAAYAQIYGMAKKSVIVLDNYVDVKTLDLLRSVGKGVSRNIGFSFDVAAFVGIGNDEKSSTFELSYVSFDRRMLPRRGTSLDVSLAWMMDRPDSLDSYLRLESSLVHYMPLYKNFIVRYSAAAGTLLPSGGSFARDDLFALGGINSFKGMMYGFVRTRAYGFSQAAFLWQDGYDLSIELFYQPGLYRRMAPFHG